MRILSYFDAVRQLTLPEQAECALIAAEMSLPVWKQWSRQQDLPDFSDELIHAFNNWMQQEISSQEFEVIEKQFLRSLSTDLSQVRDPTGDYAGWSLHTVPMIALGQCKEV